MQITENFNLYELSYSATAEAKNIDNTPPAWVIVNLRKLCTHVLQPARNVVGRITTTSGYRCPQLNLLIGGSSTSDHPNGKAADIKAAETNNAELFNTLREQNNFDQLIWEYGDDKNPRWVHVSYSDNPRRQVLRCGTVNGKRTYWPI